MLHGGCKARFHRNRVPEQLGAKTKSEKTCSSGDWRMEGPGGIRHTDDSDRGCAEMEPTQEARGHGSREWVGKGRNVSSLPCTPTSSAGHHPPPATEEAGSTDILHLYILLVPRPSAIIVGSHDQKSTYLNRSS